MQAGVAQEHLVDAACRAVRAACGHRRDPSEVGGSVVVLLDQVAVGAEFLRPDGDLATLAVDLDPRVRRRLRETLRDLGGESKKAVDQIKDDLEKLQGEHAALKTRVAHLEARSPTKDEGTKTPPAKRGIAMVFQTYALYPHLTVRDNMGLGLKQAGEPKELIDSRIATASNMLSLD